MWRSQSAHTIAPQSSFRQYLRARYYDPATGTFNRLDPFFGNLHDPQSFHKYLYTHADPVNGWDPTGESMLVNVGMSMLIGGTLGAIGGAAYGAARAYADNLHGEAFWSSVGAYAFWGGVAGAAAGAMYAGAVAATAPLLVGTGTTLAEATALAKFLYGFILGSAGFGLSVHQVDTGVENDDPVDISFGVIGIVLSTFSLYSVARNLSLSRTTRPTTGDLFEMTIDTRKGPVDALAEIVVDGDTLTLKDIVVYPRGSEPLDGLTKEMFGALGAIRERAKSLGFTNLRITGRRVETSSSANPGKTVDLNIDLTK